jgi:hypothetical protein
VRNADTGGSTACYNVPLRYEADAYAQCCTNGHSFCISTINNGAFSACVRGASKVRGKSVWGYVTGCSAVGLERWGIASAPHGLWRAVWLPVQLNGPDCGPLREGILSATVLLHTL